MTQQLPQGPRQAVRLVLSNCPGRVLLAQHHGAGPADPSAPAALRYWALPGGGQEMDETRDDAARRELAEETSIRATSIRPCVRKRRGDLLRNGEPQPYIEHYVLASAASDV